MTEKAGFNWDSVPFSGLAILARPAAGAQFANSSAVPAGKRWLFMGGTFVNTTDVNAANRYCSLNILGDGTNVTEQFISDLPIIASQTSVRVTFAPGTGTSGVATSGLAIAVGIGQPIEIPAGGKIQVWVYNIQAGDRPDATFAYYVKETSA